MKLLSIRFNSPGSPQFRVSLIVCDRVAVGVGNFWDCRPRWVFCGIIKERDDGWRKIPSQFVLRVAWFGLGVRLGVPS